MLLPGGKLKPLRDGEFLSAEALTKNWKMRAEADFLTRCLLQEQQGAFNDDFSALTCKMIHQLPEIFLKMCLLDEGCISISLERKLHSFCLLSSSVTFGGCRSRAGGCGEQLSPVHTSHLQFNGFISAHLEALMKNDFSLVAA